MTPKLAAVAVADPFDKIDAKAAVRHSPLYGLLMATGIPSTGDLVLPEFSRGSSEAWASSNTLVLKMGIAFKLGRAAALALCQTQETFRYQLN